MFVAGKNMKIMRNGKSVDVVVGDPVPECSEWPTFRALVNTGFVVWTPRANEAPMPASVAPRQATAAMANGVELKLRKQAAAT
jgi:hypothetical protein